MSNPISAHSLATSMLNGRTNAWITTKQAAFLKSLILKENPKYRANDNTYITDISDNTYYKLVIAPNKAGILSKESI